MIISDEQVKLIANDIAFDVHHYIMEHQEEYQLFLEQETESLTQDSIKSFSQEGVVLDENESTSRSRNSKLNIKGVG